MSKLENKSVADLEELKQDYIKKITEYKSLLTATTSRLYFLCINAWIRHYKNKLNQVETELKNREINAD